jgi:hypothetical protein
MGRVAVRAADGVRDPHDSLGGAVLVDEIRLRLPLAARAR